ncbi:MAG TPA: nitrous oxide reductase accessory protein NosL [Phycisphaerales bacterium]|nr:nitrous oxide reductase accessory protein NosL [Phycisphaerales bacterium]
MNRVTLGVLLCVGAWVLPSCVKNDADGPPNLRLGRDECVECGMIINEDRCSSAMVVNNEGVKEARLFDDIGCMLDYAHEHADKAEPAGFVHDHGTRGWVKMDQAWFVLADEEKLKTPMGSGLVAFAGREEAEKAAAAHGGTVMEYAKLSAARRAWMEARYGSPERAPAGGATGGGK